MGSTVLRNAIFAACSLQTDGQTKDYQRIARLDVFMQVFGNESYMAKDDAERAASRAARRARLTPTQLEALFTKVDETGHPNVRKEGSSRACSQAGGAAAVDVDPLDLILSGSNIEKVITKTKQFFLSWFLVLLFSCRFLAGVMPAEPTQQI